jgi:hypothetical protein
MWHDGSLWLPYGVALCLVALSFVFLYWCDSHRGWLCELGARKPVPTGCGAYCLNALRFYVV